MAACNLTLPTVPPVGAPSELTSIGVTDQTAAGFTCVATPAIVPAATACQIQSSPPLSAGREFNGDFRTVRIAPATDGPELNANDMVQKWGALAKGQKYFIRMRLVSVAGGEGAWISVTTVLTA